MTAGIVGLGLIGGSLAKAYHEAGERVLEACLLPIEAGMTSWPSVRVNETQAQRLGRGQGVRGSDRPVGQVAVLDEHGRGLGLGEVDEEGGLKPSRLFRWAAATGKLAELGAD